MPIEESFFVGEVVVLLFAIFAILLVLQSLLSYCILTRCKTKLLELKYVPIITIKKKRKFMFDERTNDAIL